MTTFHPEYAPRVPEHEQFEGTRGDLEGGEFLGRGARPELMEPGDIVTFVDEGGPFGIGAYYFDPELRIEGEHWVRARVNGGTWLKTELQF